ncbi:MAG: cytochrome c [Chloroflexi bacterium]|nr:cytochrome c [Chloroflexota bacterium]
MIPPDVRAGENVILATCSACHGMNARGIQGLGKDLLDSEFIDSLTDDELVAFIRVGRQPFDPLNTTGVLMPASGGNPALTEQNLHDVVAFLRVNAIHPERIGAGGGAVVAVVPRQHAQLAGVRPRRRHRLSCRSIALVARPRRRPKPSFCQSIASAGGSKRRRK